MKLELVPQLQMQHTLSQRRQQSAHILQLSVQELQTLLHESLQDNPLLETTAEAELDYTVREGVTPPRSSHSNDFSPPGDINSSLRSRDEQIMENVRLSRASERCQALCALIVNALDDNGYLQDRFEDLLPANCEAVSLQEWETALALVQALSLPGTAARSVSEALALQVQARKHLNPTVTRALLKLIATELDCLAQGNWKSARQRLGLSVSVFEQALRELQSLDPKPGRAYLPCPQQAIVPDVHVHKEGNRWRIVADPRSLPRVRVQQDYAAALEQQARARQDRQLQQTLTRARWLAEGLAMRRSTICRVAEQIVQRQALFFELGEQALQPMRINDLAKELALHPSTISRATANKFMSTPFGTLSFRHFFSGELETDFGGSCSTALVKEQIRRLIASESGDTPLSDVELHQALRNNSVELSKRTVTKYRLQLGIPNARERQQRARLRALGAHLQRAAN